MSSGTVRVTPRIVTSASPLNSVSPVRSLNLPLNVIRGCAWTSKKSALRRCSSRTGLPVQIFAASISPSKVDSRHVLQSNSRRPCMSLKSPRTQVTIMCMERNSTSVWPGSSIQAVTTSLAGFHHECDLVHVAPRPVLAGLQRADDRVLRFGRVLGGVSVGRGVAAGDVPACAAGAQVDPGAADAQAVLAAGELLGGIDLNLVEMCACGHGFSVAGVASAARP